MSIFRTIAMFTYLFGYMIVHYGVLRKAERAQAAGDAETVRRLVEQHIPHWSRGILNVTGVRLSVEGLDNIPKEGPCVFVANHRSYYDIPLLLASLDKPYGILAKEELEKIPLLSRWMKLLGCVFVQRDDVRASVRALNDATAIVESGRSFIIFPEGTRYKGARRRPPDHSGTAVTQKLGGHCRMASYRYERDIDPKDIAPRREKQYTRKERWANWWDYNLKWVILIGIAVVFVAYNFIGQYFFVTKPDYNVAVVAPYYLPEDTVNALQEALADYGEDRNGDGKVVVTLNVYTLDYAEGETQTESDAYLTMAGTTKLAADVQGGLSSVFLLWDPAGFEESTGSLRYLDGSLPAADSDEDWWNMVYKWSDCPVLAGLGLGSYGPDTTQSRSGSSQEYMSQFYVGMRGAWNSGTADNLAGGEELWQKLTAGAVSTVAPEG